MQAELEGLSVQPLEALAARLHEIAARFEDGDGDDEALGDVDEDLPDALADGPGGQDDVPGGELLLEPPEVEGQAQAPPQLVEQGLVEGILPPMPVPIVTGPALAVWEAGVGASNAAVADWRNQLGAALGDNLALVEYEEAGCIHTSFVHWTDVDSRRGRFVRVDGESRIVYTIPAFVPVRDFSHDRVIHPNAGVRMLKVPRRFRPRLPEELLRLQQVWTLALGGVAETGQCVLCTRPADEIPRCAFCCLLWHPECAVQASRELPRHDAGRLQLRRPEWPDHLARLPLVVAGAPAGLCALCHR